MTSDNQLRIPQAVIDSLVTNTDIVHTVGSAIKLKKQGKDYVGLCPFHKETTPSFSVSTVKQFYYCFGCGAGGNSMNFKMEYFGKSFISVIQEMAEDNGIDLTPYLRMAQNGQLEFKLLPAMAKASAFFTDELSACSADSTVRQYLQGRSISQAAIDRFQLGFAGSSPRIVEALSNVKEEMVLGGILEEGERGIFSSFRDRLMMPIRDTRGKTIGLSGRTLKEDVKPKYKNSKESQLFSRNSVLYGLYEALETFGVEKLDHIDVVEGQIDVIAQWMIGRPACAAMGSSVSPQQLRLLMRHAKSITFMFDGDAAGIKAMIQVCLLLLEHVAEHDTNFNVTMLPTGEDPHSLITQNMALFEQSIQNPLPWLDALFMYMPEAADLETDRGRAEFASRCVELIHDTRDPLLRHQAIEKASKACGIPVQTLNERLLSLPLSRSGQANKNPQRLVEDAAIRFARMIWDEPRLAAQVKHPTLWVEEGDALTALLGQWVADCHAGAFDGQYSEADMEALNASPERLEDIEAKSRWRVAGAALGRRLVGAQIPGLTELLMKEEPESGSSVALAHAWHITGSCAAKAMASISQKASMNLLSPEDRTRFSSLMLIRKDAATRLRA